MTNSLVSSFQSLELAVRENPRDELFPDLSRARSRINGNPSEEDHAEPDISAETLRTDKYEALKILNKWKVSARLNKKRDAEKDCDFVIRFINSICP